MPAALNQLWFPRILLRMACLDHVSLARFRVAFEIHIRKCEETDLELLEWEGLFSEHRAIFHQAFQRQLAGENLMLVADTGNYPVGQVWIDLVKRAEQGAGYIWALRLLPGLRRQGIGKRLILSAEAVLREQRFHFAELGVETWNVDALRLYRRLSYKVLDLIQETTEYHTPEGNRRVHQTEQWLMRKQLSCD